MHQDKIPYDTAQNVISGLYLSLDLSPEIAWELVPYLKQEILRKKVETKLCQQCTISWGTTTRGLTEWMLFDGCHATSHP